MNPILNWNNPVHLLTKCSLSICFNVIYFYMSLSQNWSLAMNFAKNISVRMSLPFSVSRWVIQAV